MLILFAQYCCAEQLLDLNVKRINPYDERESWFKGVCRTLLDVFLPKPRSHRDSNPRPHNFCRHIFNNPQGGGGGGVVSNMHKIEFEFLLLIYKARRSCGHSRIHYEKSINPKFHQEWTLANTNVS